MTESVYKIIELVGTSKESWEKAAVAAVHKAGKTLRDLRVAEVGRLDLQLKDGKVVGTLLRCCWLRASCFGRHDRSHKVHSQVFQPKWLA
jgi:dodecin